MRVHVAGGTGWTSEMDAALLEARGVKRLVWASVVHFCPGMSKKRCQDRYKFLLELEARGEAMPARATAEEVRLARAEREDRDLEAEARNGVDWLLKKNRLNSRRFRAAEVYRKAFHDGAGATGAIRSALAIREGGKGVGGVELVALANIQAAADLHAMRADALLSQNDLLMVMDAVCGVGMTPRQLAGGDGHKAATIEAVLMIGLDLIARWLDLRARKDG